MKCEVIEMPFVLQSPEGFPQILPVGTVIGDGTEYAVPKGTQKPKDGPFKGKVIPRFIPGPNLKPLDAEATEVQQKYAPDAVSVDDIPVHGVATTVKGQKAQGF